ncbi:hypothetical protein CDAR_96761 [Caerostris darwini]|uniref:Uncharacterized protein n=1 Tax=Caerostris darwini TaxID=1538125 RepID=A0AAV4QXL1_9ARAC|nr:hypothetical protein CDAR_96761 [Caerostris darwini]
MFEIRSAIKNQYRTVPQNVIQSSPFPRQKRNVSESHALLFICALMSRDGIRGFLSEQRLVTGWRKDSSSDSQQTYAQGNDEPSFQKYLSPGLTIHVRDKQGLYQSKDRTKRTTECLFDAVAKHVPQTTHRGKRGWKNSERAF